MPPAKGDDEDYALYATPSAVDARAPGEAEIVRRGEGRPLGQQGYNDPQGPPEPAVGVSAAVGVPDDDQKDNIITVHGYMHKQGKRGMKGPIHKSWKRRYFGTFAYPSWDCLSLGDVYPQVANRALYYPDSAGEVAHLLLPEPLGVPPVLHDA